MIVFGTIIAIPLAAYLLFSFFFEDWGDFWKCVRYYLTPDFISLLRGEWMEDWWASFKLGLYLALVAGASFAANFGLHRLLDS
jgi:ABC-type spermidine/putrescine transport system permease subunit II